MWPGDDCDLCRVGGGSAPPAFNLPPPPLPPFLTSQMDESVADIFCNDISLHDTDMCNSLLMLDNMHHSSLAFRVSNIIVVCSALFVVIGLLGILAIVKCRQRILKKMNSNKGDISSHYHECFRSINASGNQALYEDITEVSFCKAHNKFVEPLPSHTKITPFKKQSLQTIAVHYPKNSKNQQVKICSTSAYNSENIYGETPIYEELPGERDTDLDSENEDGFAEDESSLVDETQSTTLPLQNDIELPTWKQIPTERNIQIGWKQHGLLISPDISQSNSQYYPEYCCKCSSRYMIPKANYDSKVMLPIIKPLRGHHNPQSVHPQSISLQSIHPQSIHHPQSIPLQSIQHPQSIPLQSRHPQGIHPQNNHPQSMHLQSIQLEDVHPHCIIHSQSNHPQSIIHSQGKHPQSNHLRGNHPQVIQHPQSNHPQVIQHPQSNHPQVVQHPQVIQHPQSDHPHSIHPQGCCATSANECLHQDSSFGSDSGYSNHTHNSYSRTGKVVLSSAFEHQ